MGALSESLSIVTELFEPNIGGQENRFARFAELLAARGRPVTVYTSDHTGGTLPTRTVTNGVEVVRYTRLRRYVRNGSRGLLPLLRYWIATRRLLRTLARRGGPVWINQMPVAHLLGTAPAPGMGIDWCEYPTDWKIDRIARRLVRRWRHGTAVSQIVSDHLRGIRRDLDLEVVRTPVAIPSDPSPPRQEGTIVYVGRIVAHKNLGALAEAVRELHGNGGPHPRLLVAGDGPDRPALERTYGGSEQVRFLGRVSEAEKQRLIRSAWLLAIPGTREGYPTVAAEANVYGTPLLASGSALNSAGEFIRANDVGTVASGVHAADFVEALRGIDNSSWERWRVASTRLRSLYDPTTNVRRLEGAIGRWAN